jgi:hypothetical protein
MMRNLRGWVLLLACIFAKPAIAQTPPAADRAFHLIGRWSCENVDHTTGELTYTRNHDGSIAMHNAFRTVSGMTGQFTEVYRLGAKTKQWAWHSSDGHGFNEHGFAWPWDSRTWTIEGVADAIGRTKARPGLHHLHFGMRLVYTDLGDDAFQREFQNVQGRARTWTSYSIGTCRRI